MDEQEQKHSEREHFFGAAKVVAGLTLVSRVFGMVRDIAITSLGVNAATAAFVLAFKIPNLFRRLFGEGALAAAFVPVFSETVEKEGFGKASRLLANTLGLLAVFLPVLMVLALAGLMAWISFWPGRWDTMLLLALTSAMLPFMVTICLLALGAAALNCRGHFAYPAAAPIILNVFIIAAAWFVAPAWRKDVPGQLYVIASSVTFAGIVQLLAVLWLLHRNGFSVRPRLRPMEAGIKPMFRLLVPMLVGLGFLQISELLNDVIAWLFSARDYSETIVIFGREFARPLEKGALVPVYAAQRLYQFPMGVLAISLGVAIFPLMSRYAARGDMQNLRDSLNRALRLALMEGLAAGTGLFVLAEPITKLIYQHRRFTPANAETAAFILQMYVLGMWAYCTSQIFTRAFYALKDVKTPLKVACSMVGLSLPVVILLIWVPQIRAGAFGLATACAAGLNTIILAVVLRRRMGRIGGRTLAKSFARSSIACAAMAEALYLIRWQFTDWANWLVVCVCVPAGAAVFLLVVRLLRAPELGELLGAMRKPKAEVSATPKV